MADEYLQQQDEVTEPDEAMILLIVQPGLDDPPADNVPKYVTLKNLRTANRIFFRRPGGGFVEMSATDDDANPIVWQIHTELPE